MSTRQNTTPQDTGLVAAPSGVFTENGFVPCGKVTALTYARNGQQGVELLRRGVAHEKA